MRYALGIEYDGSDFFGWQRLSHGASLQGAVEKALSRVADHPVEVVCSGRTDAGVHAICQVVHFESHATRDVRAWMLGGNANLPAAIRILWAQPVATEFHARYAARARRYRYTILNRMVQPALERFRAAWQRVPLDAERMHRAAQVLVGQHDFSAFRTVHCQAPHARRDLHSITVWRESEHVVMEVQANAFLHHMVRNIMGSLIPIGRGERDESWMQELLDGRDRSLAGPTAQPEGLVFLGPLYPAEWCLPAQVTQ